MTQHTATRFFVRALLSEHAPIVEAASHALTNLNDRIPLPKEDMQSAIRPLLADLSDAERLTNAMLKVTMLVFPSVYVYCSLVRLTERAKVFKFLSSFCLCAGGCRRFVVISTLCNRKQCRTFLSPLGGRGFDMLRIRVLFKSVFCNPKLPVSRRKCFVF